jgi:hypothetical protein
LKALGRGERRRKRMRLQGQSLSTSGLQLDANNLLFSSRGLDAG